MATTTTNLGLTKPAGTDAVDIAVINANMDTIDTNLSKKADLTSTASGKGASLIGIQDSAGKITATTVEGALAELAPFKSVQTPVIQSGTASVSSFNVTVPSSPTEGVFLLAVFVALGTGSGLYLVTKLSSSLIISTITAGQSVSGITSSGLVITVNLTSATYVKHALFRLGWQ